MREFNPSWLAAGLAGRHTRAFRNQREIDRAERAGGRMQPQPGPGSVAPVISGTTANERLVDWFRSEGLLPRADASVGTHR